MDDLNLYDDLDEFQQQEDKKSKEFQEVEAKYKESLQTIQDLENENKTLKKKIQRIELNFQSLLDTARTEINRKDRDIERLRKEKDDICFRRKISPRNKNDKAPQFLEETLQQQQVAKNPFKTASKIEHAIDHSGNMDVYKQASPFVKDKLDLEWHEDDSQERSSECSKRYRSHDDDSQHRNDNKKHKNDNLDEMYQRSKSYKTELKHDLETRKFDKDCRDKKSYNKHDHGRSRCNRDRSIDRYENKYLKTSKSPERSSRLLERVKSRSPQRREHYRNLSESGRSRDRKKNSRSPERNTKRMDNYRSRDRERWDNQYKKEPRNKSRDLKKSEKYTSKSSRSPERKDRKYYRDKERSPHKKSESFKNKFDIYQDLGNDQPKDLTENLEIFEDKVSQEKPKAVETTEKLQISNKDQNNEHIKESIQYTFDLNKATPHEKKQQKVCTDNDTETLGLENFKEIIKDNNKDAANECNLKDSFTLQQESDIQALKLCTPHKITLDEALFGLSPSNKTTSPILLSSSSGSSKTKLIIDECSTDLTKEDEFNNDNENDKVLQKPNDIFKELSKQQNTSTSHKLCTPRKLALFDTLFGESPTSCSSTTTSASNSNTLLTNIMCILSKTSNTEVISSATTSPGDYTDISSLAQSPLKNKTYDPMDFDKCFTKNDVANKIENNTSAVDLTVDDEDVDDIEYTAIPGLDLQPTCYSKTIKTKSLNEKLNELMGGNVILAEKESEEELSTTNNEKLKNSLVDNSKTKTVFKKLMEKEGEVIDKQQPSDSKIFESISESERQTNYLDLEAIPALDISDLTEKDSETDNNDSKKSDYLSESESQSNYLESEIIPGLDLISESEQKLSAINNEKLKNNQVDNSKTKTAFQKLEEKESKVIDKQQPSDSKKSEIVSESERQTNYSDLEAISVLDISDLTEKDSETDINDSTKLHYFSVSESQSNYSESEIIPGLDIISESEQELSAINNEKLKNNLVDNSETKTAFEKLTEKESEVIEKQQPSDSKKSENISASERQQINYSDLEAIPVLDISDLSEKDSETDLNNSKKSDYLSEAESQFNYSESEIIPGEDIISEMTGESNIDSKKLDGDFERKSNSESQSNYSESEIIPSLDIISKMTAESNRDSKKSNDCGYFERQSNSEIKTSTSLDMISDTTEESTRYSETDPNGIKNKNNNRTTTQKNSSISATSNINEDLKTNTKMPIVDLQNNVKPSKSTEITPDNKTTTIPAENENIIPLTVILSDSKIQKKTRKVSKIDDKAVTVKEINKSHTKFNKQEELNFVKTEKQILEPVATSSETLESWKNIGKMQKIVSEYFSNNSNSVEILDVNVPSLDFISSQSLEFLNIFETEDHTTNKTADKIIENQEELNIITTKKQTISKEDYKVNKVELDVEILDVNVSSLDFISSQSLEFLNIFETEDHTTNKTADKIIENQEELNIITTKKQTISKEDYKVNKVELENTCNFKFPENKTDKIIVGHEKMSTTIKNESNQETLRREPKTFASNTTSEDILKETDTNNKEIESIHKSLEEPEIINVGNEVKTLAQTTFSKKVLKETDTVNEETEFKHKFSEEKAKSYAIKVLKNKDVANEEINAYSKDLLKKTDENKETLRTETKPSVQKTFSEKVLIEPDVENEEKEQTLESLKNEIVNTLNTNLAEKDTIKDTVVVIEAVVNSSNTVASDKETFAIEDDVIVSSESKHLNKSVNNKCENELNPLKSTAKFVLEANLNEDKTYTNNVCDSNINLSENSIKETVVIEDIVSNDSKNLNKSQNFECEKHDLKNLDKSANIECKNQLDANKSVPEFDLGKTLNEEIACTKNSEAAVNTSNTKLTEEDSAEETAVVVEAAVRSSNTALSEKETIVIEDIVIISSDSKNLHKSQNIESETQDPKNLNKSANIECENQLDSIHTSNTELTEEDSVEETAVVVKAAVSSYNTDLSEKETIVIEDIVVISSDSINLNSSNLNKSSNIKCENQLNPNNSTPEFDLEATLNEGKTEDKTSTKNSKAAVDVIEAPVSSFDNDPSDIETFVIEDNVIISSDLKNLNKSQNIESEKHDSKNFNKSSNFERENQLGSVMSIPESDLESTLNEERTEEDKTCTKNTKAEVNTSITEETEKELIKNDSTDSKKQANQEKFYPVLDLKHASFQESKKDEVETIDKRVPNISLAFKNISNIDSTVKESNIVNKDVLLISTDSTNSKKSSIETENQDLDKSSTSLDVNSASRAETTRDDVNASTTTNRELSANILAKESNVIESVTTQTNVIPKNGVSSKSCLYDKSSIIQEESEEDGIRTPNETSKTSDSFSMVEFRKKDLAKEAVVIEDCIILTKTLSEKQLNNNEAFSIPDLDSVPIKNQETTKASVNLTIVELTEKESFKDKSEVPTKSSLIKETNEEVEIHTPDENCASKTFDNSSMIDLQDKKLVKDPVVIEDVIILTKSTSERQFENNPILSVPIQNRETTMASENSPSVEFTEKKSVKEKSGETSKSRLSNKTIPIQGTNEELEILTLDENGPSKTSDNSSIINLTDKKSVKEPVVIEDVIILTKSTSETKHQETAMASVNSSIGEITRKESVKEKSKASSSLCVKTSPREGTPEKVKILTSVENCPSKTSDNSSLIDLTDKKSVKEPVVIEDVIILTKSTSETKHQETAMASVNSSIGEITRKESVNEKSQATSKSSLSVKTNSIQGTTEKVKIFTPDEDCPSKTFHNTSMIDLTDKKSVKEPVVIEDVIIITKSSSERQLENNQIISMPIQYQETTMASENSPFVELTEKESVREKSEATPKSGLNFKPRSIQETTEEIEIRTPHKNCPGKSSDNSSNLTEKESVKDTVIIQSAMVLTKTISEAPTKTLETTTESENSSIIELTEIESADETIAIENNVIPGLDLVTTQNPEETGKSENLSNFLENYVDPKIDSMDFAKTVSLHELDLTQESPKDSHNKELDKSNLKSPAKIYKNANTLKKSEKESKSKTNIEKDDIGTVTKDHNKSTKSANEEHVEHEDHQNIFMPHLVKVVESTNQQNHNKSTKSIADKQKDYKKDDSISGLEKVDSITTKDQEKSNKIFKTVSGNPKDLEKLKSIPSLNSTKDLTIFENREFTENLQKKQNIINPQAQNLNESDNKVLTKEQNLTDLETQILNELPKVEIQVTNSDNKLKELTFTNSLSNISDSKTIENQHENQINSTKDSPQKVAKNNDFLVNEKNELNNEKLDKNLKSNKTEIPKATELSLDLTKLPLNMPQHSNKELIIITENVRLDTLTKELPKMENVRLSFDTLENVIDKSKKLQKSPNKLRKQAALDLTDNPKSTKANETDNKNLGLGKDLSGTQEKSGEKHNLKHFVNKEIASEENVLNLKENNDFKLPQDNEEKLVKNDLNVSEKETNIIAIQNPNEISKILSSPYMKSSTAVIQDPYNTPSLLPSISTNIPTPPNFSGIFSKKSLEVCKEDDLIKSKKRSPYLPTTKPREYIIPAASVLCNVDNLENANKKLHWELLENNEMTEIEDDTDVDNTDEERKHISAKQYEPQPRLTPYKCTESLTSDSETQSEDDSRYKSVSSLNSNTNRGKSLEERPKIVDTVPITYAISYYKQLEEMEKQKELELCAVSYYKHLEKIEKQKELKDKLSRKNKKQLKLKTSKVIKQYKQPKQKISKDTKDKLPNIKILNDETLMDDSLIKKSVIQKKTFSIVLPKKQLGKLRKFDNFVKASKRGRKGKLRKIKETTQQVAKVLKKRGRPKKKLEDEQCHERISKENITDELIAEEPINETNTEIQTSDQQTENKQQTEYVNERIEINSNKSSVSKRGRPKKKREYEQSNKRALEESSYIENNTDELIEEEHTKQTNEKRQKNNEENQEQTSDQQTETKQQQQREFVDQSLEDNSNNSLVSKRGRPKKKREDEQSNERALEERTNIEDKTDDPIDEDQTNEIIQITNDEIPAETSHQQTENTQQHQREYYNQHLENNSNNSVVSNTNDKSLDDYQIYAELLNSSINKKETQKNKENNEIKEGTRKEKEDKNTENNEKSKEKLKDIASEQQSENKEKVIATEQQSENREHLIESIPQQQTERVKQQYDKNSDNSLIPKSSKLPLDDHKIYQNFLTNCSKTVKEKTQAFVDVRDCNQSSVKTSAIKLTQSTHSSDCKQTSVETSTTGFTQNTHSVDSSRLSNLATFEKNILLDPLEQEKATENQTEEHEIKKTENISIVYYKEDSTDEHNSSVAESSEPECNKYLIIDDEVPTTSRGVKSIEKNIQQKEVLKQEELPTTSKEIRLEESQCLQNKNTQESQLTTHRDGVKEHINKEKLSQLKKAQTASQLKNSETLIKSNSRIKKVNVNKTYTSSSISANNKKIISLEDIGINVRPFKGHLSSFRIPKMNKDLEETKDKSWKLETYSEISNECNKVKNSKESDKNKELDFKNSKETQILPKQKEKNENKKEKVITLTQQVEEKQLQQHKERKTEIIKEIGLCINRKCEEPKKEKDKEWENKIKLSSQISKDNNQVAMQNNNQISYITSHCSKNKNQDSNPIKETKNIPITTVSNREVQNSENFNKVYNDPPATSNTNTIKQRRKSVSHKRKLFSPDLYDPEIDDNLKSNVNPANGSDEKIYNTKSCEITSDQNEKLQEIVLEWSNNNSNSNSIKGNNTQNNKDCNKQISPKTAPLKTRRKSVYVEQITQENISVESNDKILNESQQKQNMIERKNMDLNAKNSESNIKDNSHQIKKTTTLKTRRKSLHLQRRILDSSSDEDTNKNSLNTLQPSKVTNPVTDSHTTKLIKSRRKSVNLQRRLVDSSCDEEINETISEKTSFKEKVETQIITDINLQPVSLKNSEDTNQLTKPIQSLRMRKKSMIAEQKLLNSFTNDEKTMENVKKSSNLLSQTIVDKKHVNNQLKDVDRIQEVTNKPPLKIRRKSVYQERNVLTEEHEYKNQSQTIVDKNEDLESPSCAEDVSNKAPLKIRRKSVYRERGVLLDDQEKDKNLSIKPKNSLDQTQLEVIVCNNESENSKQVPILKIRRKSMYQEKVTLNIEPEEKGNIEQPDLKSQSSIDNNQLDIISSNKAAIASLKMRRKSMYQEKTFLNKQKEDRDIVKKDLVKPIPSVDKTQLEIENSKKEKDGQTKPHVTKGRRKSVYQERVQKEGKLEKILPKSSSSYQLEKRDSVTNNEDKPILDKKQLEISIPSLDKNQLEIDYKNEKENQIKPHLPKGRRKSLYQEKVQEEDNIDELIKKSTLYQLEEGDSVTKNQVESLTSLDKNQLEINSTKKENEIKPHAAKRRRKSVYQERFEEEAKIEELIPKSSFNISQTDKMEKKGDCVTNNEVEPIPSLYKKQVEINNSKENEINLHVAKRRRKSVYQERVQEQRNIEELIPKTSFDRSHQTEEMLKGNQLEEKDSVTNDQVEAISSLDKSQLEVKSQEEVQQPQIEAQIPKSLSDRSQQIDKIESKFLETSKEIEIGSQDINPNINSNFSTDENLKKDCTNENNSDTSVVLSRKNTIKLRRQSINQRRILDSSSEDNDYRENQTQTVILNEETTPLTANKPKTRKRRVVKVLSTSREEPSSIKQLQLPEITTHAGQQPSLISPTIYHPIFNTEVSQKHIDSAAILPPTPNKQYDDKFKEIDTKLNELFQSPQYMIDYKTNTNSLNDSALTVVDPAILNDSQMNITIEETIVCDPKNDQSSANITHANDLTTSLHDDNDSLAHNESEIKHLSLGTSDYRFEKVSDNVVNLFISRKRKRKRTN